MAYTYKVDIKTNVDLKSAEALEKYLEKIKKTSDEINSAHGADEINQAYERNAKAIDNVKRSIVEAGKKFNEAKANLSVAIGAKDIQGINKYAQEMKSLQNVLTGMRDALNYDAEIKGSSGMAMYKSQLEDIANILKGINQAGDRANTAIGSSGARELSEATKVTRDRVESMKKSFSQLGSIIKSSFVDSIKVGTGAVKKYFGLLGKSAKGIFNLIKKGFTGGSNSESSNPLVSLLKKGVTFYGVKQLIGELNNLISKTSEVGGVAGQAFAEYNGQLSAVKENLRNIGIVGATGLIQALTPVISILNSITSYALQAAYAIANIFGFGDIAQAAVKGYDAEAEAISGVGAAAKKAEIGLQSFDKLNNNASEAGEGGGGGVSKAVKALPKDPKKIQWLEDLFNLMNNGEWEKAGKHVANGINTMSNAIYKGLTNPEIPKKIHTFNNALTDFLKGLLDIDTNKIGRNIGAGVNIISTFINDLYTQLSDKNILKTTGTRIAQFFEGMFDETDWTALGQALATKFRVVIDIFSGFIQEAQTSDLGTKAGTAVKEFLVGAIDRLFGSGGAEDIGKSIGGLINLAFDFIHSSIGDSETNKKIFEAIKTTITTAVQNVDASKMKDAAVDIANLIGDLLNTAADTINENSDAISGAVAGTVNGLADSGALSNIAKGVTGFFLALANLMGQTVKKIDWIEVGSAILEGIGDAISENPEGMQFLVTAFSILFGVKLIGKLASFGISALATAIGNNLVSSIASKLGTEAAVSTVVGSGSTGLIGLISKLGTAGVIAAATMMGISVADAIVSGAKDKLTELDDLADHTEEVWGKRFSDTFDAADGKILFQSKSIGQYKDKLDELSKSFYAINLDIDGLGARGKKVDEVRRYLNKLEEAGMGANSKVQYLKASIEEYDNLRLGSDKEAKLAEIEAAARDCNIEIGNSKAAVNNLDMSSLDNIGVEFDEFKVGVKFTDTELKMIEQSGETAGKTLGTGEVAGVQSKYDDIHTSIEAGIKIPDDIKNDAKNEGKSVGENITSGINEGIEAKKRELLEKAKSVANETLKAFKLPFQIHSPSRVMRDEIGANIMLGLAEGLSDEESAVLDSVSAIDDAIMSSMMTHDMSDYFDFSGVPRSIAVSPEVQKAQMQSILAQNQSTAGLGSALSLLNHQLNSGKGNNMRVAVYLDANNKLGEFIIDTVNGSVIKSGNF